MSRYDVVTLGEALLRLTPPNMLRFEQAKSFDIHVGGSESNTAVGLARLGLKVCWLSRLTRNPLGRLIATAIASHGVDMSHIVWTADDRNAIYFVEEGKKPRGIEVVYDRDHTATSRMSPSDLPIDLFQPGGARLLHLTGITPALSQSAADTAEHALDLAREAGWLVSFDVNYRSKLWAPDEARRVCESFMRAADIIFVPLTDATVVYGLPDDLESVSALEAVAERYREAVVVMTLGSDGAIACQPGGEICRQTAFVADEVDRIGGGDAFSAGFLCGYLGAEDAAQRLSSALKWGAAAAALKYTIPGDMPIIDKAEVEALVRDGAEASRIAR